MGVSFEQNTVRRDVSVSYEMDLGQNMATVHVKTPMKQFQSIKLSSMIMSDMGSQMNFNFETQGENNCWEIGLKYDFTRGFSNGIILAKIIDKRNVSCSLH